MRIPRRMRLPDVLLARLSIFLAGKTKQYLHTDVLPRGAKFFYHVIPRFTKRIL